MVPMTLNSTSIKSLVIRLMTSPFLDSVNQLIGSRSTLLYKTVAQVTAHTCPHRRQTIQCEIAHGIFQHSDAKDADADVRQSAGWTNLQDKRIEIGAPFFYTAARGDFNHSGRILSRLKQDPQKGYDTQKSKQGQKSVQDVANDIDRQV